MAHTLELIQIQLILMSYLTFCKTFVYLLGFFFGCGDVVLHCIY